MKKKSQGLRLSRETIRSLDKASLGDVEGGGSLACTTSLLDSIGCSPFPTYGSGSGSREY
jgi:hypothetical protein